MKGIFTKGLELLIFPKVMLIQSIFMLLLLLGKIQLVYLLSSKDVHNITNPDQILAHVLKEFQERFVSNSFNIDEDFSLITKNIFNTDNEFLFILFRQMKENKLF